MVHPAASIPYVCAQSQCHRAQSQCFVRICKLYVMKVMKVSAEFVSQGSVVLMTVSAEFGKCRVRLSAGVQLPCSKFKLCH